MFKRFAIAVLLTGCVGAPLSSQHSTPEVRRLASSECPCLYVANAIYRHHTDSPRITVYAPGGSGDVAPLQEIKGSKTGLDYPMAVALDGNGNIYVANYDGNSVAVYAAGATGNVAPTATISGSNTGLYVPQGVAINPVNGDIYVSNEPRTSSYNGTITIYAPGSNGNVSPLGVIQGPAAVASDNRTARYVMTSPAAGRRNPARGASYRATFPPQSHVNLQG
ncbi:MAG: hypothetical protein WBV67_17640 [Candidatus Cybelea sp.]